MSLSEGFKLIEFKLVGFYCVYKTILKTSLKAVNLDLRINNSIFLYSVLNSHMLTMSKDTPTEILLCNNT